MKKMLVLIGLMCFVSSVAHAATIVVPTQQATIQAAINAASDGDTISIADSATYAGALRINKQVNIVAATGQTPKIQNDSTTNGVTIIFQANSGGSKLGSLTGGRIKLELLKVVTGTGIYNPANFMQFQQTTGTLVTVENCDILETGTTTVAGINCIYQSAAIANKIVFDHVDLNVNRTASGGVYAIILGTTSAIPSTSQGGPQLTLNRVRITGYSRAGVWNNFSDSRIDMNECELGTVAGEQQAALTYPWGGFISHQAASRFSGVWTNSIIRGGYNGAAAQIGANGSSVTLSRCVLINKMGNSAATAPSGALLVGATAGTPLANSDRIRINADHCDFVDLSVSKPTVFGAIATRPVTSAYQTTFTVTVANSNIYSESNPALQLALRAGDVFTLDHCNDFGLGSNVGITGPTGSDPRYPNALTGDLRYANNTLKTGDSAGGPIGTNGEYSNVYTAGVIAGDAGYVNRAHGWATLK